LMRTLIESSRSSNSWVPLSKLFCINFMTIELKNNIHALQKKEG
jgi:hypothetical protein